MNHKNESLIHVASGLLSNEIGDHDLLRANGHLRTTS